MDNNNFNSLIENIEKTHKHLQNSASNAINQMLTMRNWLIGCYIVEFEQNGKDRAEYGKYLLKSLSVNLKNIKGMDERSLRRFRQFYLYYPQLTKTIRGLSTPDLNHLEIRGLLTPESQNKQKMGTASPQLSKELFMLGEKILSKLSYSHIEQLLSIPVPLKRTFYEIECIKGTWSVKELKRQIRTLLYERSGLSEKPELLLEKVNQHIEHQNPKSLIKNVYSFEFLDLPHSLAVEETELETALINNLQDFILELGNGFCFEAKQKRILIGEKYYFIDLVFYHRILRCHVLIELKVEDFDHANAGQLNTYINYYKKNVMHSFDNPTVGILMVTDKDKALVEYATAGMDENLFVSQYMLQLPNKETLTNFITNELKEL